MTHSCIVLLLGPLQPRHCLRLMMILRGDERGGEMRGGAEGKTREEKRR